jgi:hypothetical protein
VIKRLQAYLWVGLGLVLLYVGYTFADRYFTNRHLERNRAPVQAKLPEFVSTSELKILQFYAAPAGIARGEKGVLCYSVINAKSVALDPPIDRVWPALNRCLEIRPEKDTRYTFTAEGADGQKVIASFLLKLGPGR